MMKRPKQTRLAMAMAAVVSLGFCGMLGAQLADRPALTYRHFQVVEDGHGRVARIEPIEARTVPTWAADVSQQIHVWPDADSDQPLFEKPIPFVRPPLPDSGEPFHIHNHQPDICWLPNGDLLAVWYSTGRESGTELTVLASRLRAGREEWDPSAEFFKAENRNMHGNSIFYDEKAGILHHVNGMGPEGATGWERLALLHRYSRDNGVTWSPARPISSGASYQSRHQVIAGMVRMTDGTLVQPCDATHGSQGPTAVHVSRDGGETWHDPGGDIRGIHAGVEELRDGRLMAFGRGQPIEGRMPVSLSSDLGRTWSYRPSPFPPIGGGQRLVFRRLREGPLLFISFTSGDRHQPEANGMMFVDRDGNEFTGHGMFAALSFDEGQTWPVRKLLTPGEGDYDGGAHTGSFTATPTRAEHAGYLAATQTPDGAIHLISSRLHYRFNLAWLTAGTEEQNPRDGELQSFLRHPHLDMQQFFGDERFPNIVVAVDGTVVATWGSRNVRARRSKDGGQTWGPEIPIGQGIHGGGVIVDERQGDILLFTHPEHPPRDGTPAPRTMYRSTDHGRTWQAEAASFHPDARGFLPSLHMSEHGCSLVHGSRAGRLIRPARVYHSAEGRYSAAIYSDDGGRNWQAGGPFPLEGTGEGALLELSDGCLLYSARRSFFPENEPLRHERVFARSDDGGQTWRDPVHSAAVPDGPRYRGTERRGANYNGHFGLFAGLARLPVRGRDILLYSNADHDGHERIRLTVWASFDGGETWPVKRLVDEGLSAYSSLAAGRPGTASEGWIYLLYEHGREDRQYAGGNIARFNLAWLLEGEPTGDGQLPDWLSASM